jgi:YbbR domain-containing protein
MKEDKFSATAFVSMLITLLAIAVFIAVDNNNNNNNNKHLECLE